MSLPVQTTLLSSSQGCSYMNWKHVSLSWSQPMLFNTECLILSIPQTICPFFSQKETKVLIKGIQVIEHDSCRRGLIFAWSLCTIRLNILLNSSKYSFSLLSLVKVANQYLLSFFSFHLSIKALSIWATVVIDL